MLEVQEATKRESVPSNKPKPKSPTGAKGGMFYKLFTGKTEVRKKQPSSKQPQSPTRRPERVSTNSVDGSNRLQADSSEPQPPSSPNKEEAPRRAVSPDPKAKKSSIKVKSPVRKKVTKVVRKASSKSPSEASVKDGTSPSSSAVGSKAG